MKNESKFANLPGVDQIKNKSEMRKAINLLDEAAQLQQEIEQKTKRFDEIKEELLVIQDEYNLPGFRNGNRCYSATWIEGRRSLSKDALIENGVDPQVISESYRQGEGYYKRDIKVLDE